MSWEDDYTTSSRSSKSSSGGFIATVIGGLLGLALVIGIIVAFTTHYSIPSDMVAVKVGAGPFEASKIKGCVPASSRGWFTNDDYKMYPTSEREWDATGQDGSDGSRFKSVTKDNVEMYVPVTVRFTLKTDCDTLSDFYTRYGRRYGVEFDSDGTYNEAWITVLRKLMADPADATLDRIIQDFNWRNVWNDPGTKVQIEDRLNKELQSSNSLLVQTAKGAFFEGISVLVGKPEPGNPALAEAVASEQAKVADAQSREAESKALKATAEAETAQAEAEAAKQQAEIRGFQLPGMSPEQALKAYNQAKAIEAGQNPFQPQYVVGGTVPPKN